MTGGHGGAEATSPVTPAIGSADAPVLAIVGPTGVGKTALAVALAAEWPIEVVSVDSRQVYRRMDIGTAKPSPEERAALRHHLIDVVEPDDRYDAARFARAAIQAIDQVRARGHHPVLVGGTGLYLRALVWGLSPLPPADLDLRRRLREQARRDGREALHARLAVLDPVAAARLHPRDLVRVIRAIEIVEVTGHPVHAVRPRRSGSGAGPALRVVSIGLTMSREALYARLDARAERMLAQGLLDEVGALLRAGFGRDLPAMQGIGYRHLAPVLTQGVSLDHAVRLMKRDTRRYAKRQWTWFAREDIMAWVAIEPGCPQAAVGRVKTLIEESHVFG